MSAKRTSRDSMFLRMLLRATFASPARLASVMVAIVVASAVATTLLEISIDAQAKMRAEFRGYGANVVVAAPEGGALPPDSLARVEGQASSGSHATAIAVPYAYAIARTADGLQGSPVVVAGTEFDRARTLNTWWSVTNWPASAGETVEALFGKRAAQSLDPDGAPLDLWFRGKKITVHSAGTLSTGGDEDSRIYLTLPQFTAWTGLSPSVVEVRVDGTPADIKAAMGHLQAALPQAQVRPVRQIVEAEAQVLGRTRSMLFWTTLAIIATAALCVAATLMTWVLDRRRDFAVMKALGASERMVMGFFAAETVLVGAAGALLGFALGLFAAASIARINFGSSLSPRFDVLPAVLIGGIVLALAAATPPLGILRRIEPAAILRGE